MRRLKTPDWAHVGWHYKALHVLGTPWHNRLWLRAKGLSNVPLEGGFLYAANHTSWWDPIALATMTPRPVCWLAKRSLGKGRFGQWFFFDKGGCIPVDRGARNPEAFAAAVRALRDGRVIGIFPEGTRHHEKLGPTKTGVARLALDADVPVVPVGIATDRFWKPGRRLPRLSERIYLRVGEPLRLSGDASDPEDARRGTDRVMDAVWDLLCEAREARDRKAPWPHPDRADAWRPAP